MTGIANGEAPLAVGPSSGRGGPGRCSTTAANSGHNLFVEIAAIRAGQNCPLRLDAGEEEYDRKRNGAAPLAVGPSSGRGGPLHFIRRRRRPPNPDARRRRQLLLPRHIATPVPRRPNRLIGLSTMASCTQHFCPH